MAYLRLFQQEHRDDPTAQQEANLAIGILLGQRPGIEEKYDALLAKLFRLRSHWMDERDRLNSLLEEKSWPVQRASVKGRLAIINKLIQDSQWIEARNRDLIDLAAKQNATSETQSPVQP